MDLTTSSKLPNSMLPPLGKQKGNEITHAMEYIGLEENVNVGLSQE